MANAWTVTSPRMAHELAHASGMDAANRQMRKAGRKRWSRADYNLCVSTTQRWYRNFNILNADQWMPEGYEWREFDGEWMPVKKEQAGAADVPARRVGRSDSGRAA